MREKEMTVSISKSLHEDLKKEKEETKIGYKYLLEKAWQMYKEAKNGSV